MSPSAKQQAIDIIEALPQDAGAEEVNFLTKVWRGLSQIEDGRVVSHEEAIRRLKARRPGGSFP